MTGASPNRGCCENSPAGARKTDAQLLQERVFSFGSDENRHVGIGVLPGGEEVFIRRPASTGVPHLAQRARTAELCNRLVEAQVVVGAIKQLLEFGRGVGRAVRRKVSRSS